MRRTGGQVPSGQHEPTNFSKEILGALEASEDGGGEIGGRLGGLGWLGWMGWRIELHSGGWSLQQGH